MTLEKIISKEILQDLQDGFSNITGICSVIVSPEGVPITVPSNLNYICETISTNENTSHKCINANVSLIEECLETKKPSSRKCPNSGLITAAVPILNGNNLLGAWIMGQIKMQEACKSDLQTTANEINQDVSILSEAIDNLTLITKEQFEMIFDYLVNTTKTIIELANAKIEIDSKHKNLLKITDELRALSSMLENFADSADVGMCVCDIETKEFLLANTQMEAIIGMPKDEIVGLHYNTLIAMDEAIKCPHETLCAEEFALGKKVVSEYFKNGKWWKRTCESIDWVGNRKVLIITFTDITNEIKAQDRLKNLAYYDQDMDIPNMLKLVADFSESNDECKYLVCFDIKQFRRVNDAYGRIMGDSLLKIIINWIKAKVSTSAEVYRVDGDEFAVYFRAGDKTIVTEFAEKLLDRFGKEWIVNINGKIAYVFCDAKICIIDGHISFGEDDSLQDFIERAMDTVVHEGAVSVYDEEADQAFKYQLILGLSLRNAINQGMTGFSVNYQPIVSIHTGKWTGVEALCRWNSPEFGIISPGIFISEAEKLGLMEYLGQWILEQSIKECKEWGFDEIEDFFIDVNFSPLQISDIKLEDKVMNVLKKYDFPPRKLCIEITESMELMGNTRINQALNNLRENEIKVALDDFGVGYSSFQSLRDYSVNTLKTENRFMRNIENDKYLQNLFRIMVDLAHIAGKDLIAEGVETPEQLEVAIANKTDYIQGYLFAKPMPITQLAKKIHKFHIEEPLLMK